MKRKIFLTNFFADVYKVPICNISYHSHSWGRVTLDVQNYGSVSIFCTKSKDTGLYCVRFVVNPHLCAVPGSWTEKELELKANFWLQMNNSLAVAQITYSDWNRSQIRIISNYWPWQNRPKQLPPLSESKQLRMFKILSEDWSNLCSDIANMLLFKYS